MRSYLIVGNQTLMGPELAAAIAERIVPGDPPDFYVVVPATPKQGAFTWDEDEANAAAQDRLDAMLGNLPDRASRRPARSATGIRSRRPAMRCGGIRSTRSSCRPCRPGSRAGSVRMCPGRLKSAVAVPVVVVTASARRSRPRAADRLDVPGR